MNTKTNCKETRQDLINFLVIKPLIEFYKNPSKYPWEYQRAKHCHLGGNRIAQCFAQMIMGKDKTSADIKAGTKNENDMLESFAKAFKDFKDFTIHPPVISEKYFDPKTGKIIKGEKADIYITVDGKSFIIELKQSDGHDTGNYKAIGEKLRTKYDIIIKPGGRILYGILYFNHSADILERHKKDYEDIEFKDYDNIYVCYGINEISNLIFKKILNNKYPHREKEFVETYNKLQNIFPNEQFHVMYDCNINNWTDEEKKYFKKKIKKPAVKYYNSNEAKQTEYKELESILSTIFFNNGIDVLQKTNNDIDIENDTELKKFLLN